jgi:hypothetical protein
MDLCSLGASTVVNDAGQYGLARASCQRIIEENVSDKEKGEDFGEMPIACALGITALPAPPSDDGTCAEGIIEPDVGGFPGVVVAAWDARTTDVAGQLSPGDTCLHGTHADATKRAKVFCKENLAAVIVGNDLALTLDRGAKAVTLAAFGHVLQVSENSILLAEKSGGNWIELKGGNNSIVGPTCIGGPGAVAVVQAAPLAVAFTAAAALCGADVGAQAAFTAMASAVLAYSTKQTLAT